MRNKRDANDMTDFQSTFNTVREDKPKGNFYVRYHRTLFHNKLELRGVGSVI
jgi:hypothetical protein